MAHTVESFVDALRTDGVEAGRQEAERIRQEAQQEAERIRSEAELCGRIRLAAPFSR